MIQYHDVTILKCMKDINEKHSTQKNELMQVPLHEDENNVLYPVHSIS